MKLAELCIFPIKSLGGISVSRALPEARGLRFDRRFMLVDEDNVFLTQRSIHTMALLKTSLNDDLITVRSDKTEFHLQLPAEANEMERRRVKVWNDDVEAFAGFSEADEFFSSQLNVKCSLVYMPDHAERKVDTKYALNQEITSFSDGFPYLLIGTASLKELNRRLEFPISMDRFRPNLVVETTAPFEEDGWKQIAIEDHVFRIAKPCGRCVMTTVNQDTGEASTEPLKTLSTFRKVGNKILFGQNLLMQSKSDSFLEVGMEVRVVE